MTVDPKEVATEKQQVSKALKAAEELVIETPEDLKGATELLSRLKTVGKMLTGKKKEITDPLNSALKGVRALFAPLEDTYSQAEKVIKEKMITYQRWVDAEAAKKQAKIAARVEKGTMKFETAQRKTAEIEAAPVSVATESGAQITYRTVKKLVVTDKVALAKAVGEGKVVADAIDPNTRVLRDLAITQGIEIPGVKVEEHKEVAAR